MFVEEKFDASDIKRIKKLLPAHKSIVFVGMMGAGKSTVGRKISFKLDMDFYDTDVEIENAAQLSISEIFATYGEAHFREIEKKIITRILNESRGVISIGGGAFMDEQLRHHIQSHGISLWLRADLETLLSRVHKQEHRPLLTQGNPEDVLKNLIDKRYPIYEKSDIIVQNNYLVPEKTVDIVLGALLDYLAKQQVSKN